MLPPNNHTNTKTSVAKPPAVKTIVENKDFTSSSDLQSKRNLEIQTCVDNCINSINKADDAETIYTYPYSSGETKYE